MQNKILKHLKLNFLKLAVLCLTIFSIPYIKADSTPACPTSFFLPRSQGANTARELVGWQEFIYKDTCNFYLTTDLVFEYQQIARYIFGSDKLTFRGSQVVDPINDLDFCLTSTTPATCFNSYCPLIADYFGLPTDYLQTINICPSIKNFILDFELFMGLDRLTKGLYFQNLI